MKFCLKQETVREARVGRAWRDDPARDLRNIFRIQKINLFQYDISISIFNSWWLTAVGVVVVVCRPSRIDQVTVECMQGTCSRTHITYMFNTCRNS